MAKHQLLTNLTALHIVLTNRIHDTISRDRDVVWIDLLDHVRHHFRLSRELANELFEQGFWWHVRHIYGTTPAARADPPPLPPGPKYAALHGEQPPKIYEHDCGLIIPYGDGMWRAATRWQGAADWTIDERIFATVEAAQQHIDMLVAEFERVIEEAWQGPG
jgi:hypothetical protein